MSDQDAKRICLSCGKEGGERLGRCPVCGLEVCTRCGNLQYAKGERFAMHDHCLRKDDGGFSMIRFVK